MSPGPVPDGLSRRATLAGLSLAAMAQAPQPGERWLWIRNEKGEELALPYRRGHAYDPAAMARLRHLFRDLRADTEGPLPGVLPDLLSLIQERLGFDRPLRLISGYRTPETNATLRYAAPNSLHMQGMAADIVVRGRPQDDVCACAQDLSQRLGFMGVGWYGSFTHVDVGPRARWTRLL